MNRSILLVICDFLILTLLSFVQFDSPTPAESTPAAEVGAAAVSAPAMSNMVAVLASALELERQQREALTNALAATSSELQERLRLLAERERHLTNVQQRLAQSESEARRLAEERARLEQARNEASASAQALQLAFETTRKTTDSLQERLSDTTREAAEAKVRLEMMEKELNRRQEEAREMQQRIVRLDESREALRVEKHQLELNLRQTEAEARVVRTQVTNLNQQLSTVAEEKAQLAQTTAHLATNVGSLARQSTAIQEQIERQIRLPANTIYGDFLSNRVEWAMTGVTRGALGQEVRRDRSGGTVLVRIGGDLFAVVHLDSTPLKIWPPEAPWTGFAAGISRGDSRVAADGFSLVKTDPRVALIPVPATQAAALGARVYDVATDPAQFAEAVVVGADERYYGESAYRLSAQSPGYLEMERSTFRRLLGEFAPKRGDLALTRTGLVLGILVSGDRCLLLDGVTTLPAFRCGTGLDPAENSRILRTAFAILERMPAHLR